MNSLRRSLLKVAWKQSCLLERRESRFQNWSFNISNCNSSSCGRMPTHLRAVLGSLGYVAPLELAEPWDNVGLLIEPTEEKQISRIMLTIDLTEEVLEEAIAKDIDMVVAYHPPIFKPLKNLRNDNWKNKIALKCIEKNIVVYSPHTAADAVSDGVNDCLLRLLDCSISVPVIRKVSPFNKCEYIVEFECSYCSDDYEKRLAEILPNVEIVRSTLEADRIVGSLIANESSIEATKALAGNEKFFKISKIAKHQPNIPGSNYGQGRYALLQNPIKISEMVEKLKQKLGLKTVRISLAKGFSLGSFVQSVAVCAGSGASVLRDATADVFITGEMSHHELLDAAHKGTTVILLEHSNSERFYLIHLAHVLQDKSDLEVDVFRSQADRDPISFV